MNIFEQMTATRDGLLAAIAEGKRGALQSIEDTQARLDKQRKEAEEIFSGLTDIVHAAYGEPDDNPNVPEAVETVVT